jgi:hypothetical protein
MSNMERVTEAITQARILRKEPSEVARAAIEAMREPSEGVLNFLSAHHSFDDAESREVCNSIVSAALGQWKPLSTANPDKS